MRGRIAFSSSLLAVCLGGLLASSAFWAPMYNDGATLLEVNGPGVLVPVSLPLALCVMAFIGLWLQCSRGSVAGERVALVAGSILGLFTIISGFSIGIFVLPIAALVGLAVATTPAP